MKLKNIIYEDFVNYKKTSMFILTTACSFKCEKEANCIGMCQNSELVKSKTIEIDNKILIDRYLNNDIIIRLFPKILDELQSVFKCIEWF